MRALLLLLALGGCASQPADFPSLAPRPIEQRSDAEPAAVRVDVAPDASLNARISDLGKVLKTAENDFDGAARRIDGSLAAARSGGVGSDAWVDAQTALSQLETARASSATALSDLERLAIDRAAAGEPPYPALETALTAAAQQSSRQAARYDSLRGSLPSP